MCVVVGMCGMQRGEEERTHHNPEVELSHELDLSWVSLLGRARVVGRLPPLLIVKDLGPKLIVRDILLLGIDRYGCGLGVWSPLHNLVILSRHNGEVLKY